MNDLLGQNLLIKKEADDILHHKGLMNILRSFGTVHISGSYELDLMTWRDLDIYLENENITEPDFFEIGKQICELLHPVKMSYRNERISKTQGLPQGLYWGTYLGNEKKGAWKIDLWAVGPDECKRMTDYCSEIKQKLTPENILTILDIKSYCWNQPGYRRTFNSSDIYNSVLENGVTNLQQFIKFLVSNS